MIEIPAWVLWGLITVPFGAGMAVSLYTVRFVTEQKCKERRKECNETVSADRKAVWDKIDRIHGMMLTIVSRVN